MNTTSTISVKHTCNEGFGPKFGKKTAGCPRCDELLNGAAPRTLGWVQRKQDKENAYRAFRRNLEAHNCQRSNCGPVCTAFEW